MGQGASVAEKDAVSPKSKEKEIVKMNERRDLSARRMHLNHPGNHKRDIDSRDCDITGTINHTFHEDYSSAESSDAEKYCHDHLQRISKTSKSDNLLPGDQANLRKSFGQKISDFDTPSFLVYEPTRTHKGLSNYTGENNCFLNVTIQALWHLGPFRFEVQKLLSDMDTNNSVRTAEKKFNTNSSLMEEKCDPNIRNNGRDENPNSLIEALCNLFVQYEFAESLILPPTELRTTLSKISSQFRIGEIADANETLEAILERIHLECTPSCPYGSHKCLAHTVFGGLLMEQSFCRSCGATSEPMLRNDFLHYVYAAELISLYHKQEEQQRVREQGQQKNDLLQDEKSVFGNLLHECLGVCPRSCPSIDEKMINEDEKDKKEGVRYSGKYTKQKYENGYGYTYNNDQFISQPINTQNNLDLMRNRQNSEKISMFSLQQEEKPSGVGNRREQMVPSQNIKNQKYSDGEKQRKMLEHELEDEERHRHGHKDSHKVKSCQGIAQVNLHSLDPASVLAITVGWTKQREDLATLESFFSLLSYSILLSDLFDNGLDNKNNYVNVNTNSSSSSSSSSSGSNSSSINKSTKKYDNLYSNDNASPRSSNISRKSIYLSRNPCYVFRGFVCYYGSHYVSIFQVSVLIKFSNFVIVIINLY